MAIKIGIGSKPQESPAKPEKPSEGNSPSGGGLRAVRPPPGAQCLIFPMFECTVAAGFLNPEYPKDKAHRFPHYGVDFDSPRAVDFNVIASGKGTVLGVEKSYTKEIGGVIVIKYDNVFLPEAGKPARVILRYMHLYTVNVRKGQRVSAYDIIGTVSGTDPYRNHVHIEVDLDINYPFNTPQVSEKASKLLIRNPASAKTLVDPMSVFVVGKMQTCKVHSMAIYADKVKDAPRFYLADGK